MKLKSILLIVGTILGVTHSANSQNQLVTYPAPEGAELMSDFTVQVREAGKDWRPVDTYMVKVDEVQNTKHNVKKPP